MTLVTGLVRVSDRGIWEAFEKAVSKREVGLPRCVNPVTEMVNLKKFCRNLRNEIVSHITFYLPSIAKPSLRYLDLILSKTLSLVIFPF